MRIITVDDSRIPFCDARGGAVIKYNGSYYMKLGYEYEEDLPQYESGATPTVVNLEDGSLACFVKTTLVEVVEAELRIKE